MVTSKHDSSSIFKIFHDLRYFCESLHSWSIFSRVMIVFSYASIHAICGSLNRCTFSEHSNICYNNIVYEKFLPDHFITIHLCSAHFMKMVSNDIKEVYCDDDNMKNYMKDVKALGIILKDISDFNKYVQHIINLLSNEFENGEVVKAKLFFETLSVSKHSKVDKDIFTDMNNTGTLHEND